MVRKGLIVIVCVLAVIMALPFTASADEAYTEGNISTTYVTYFRDILSKVSPNKDYVMFRASQTEYKMCVGNLEVNNGTIYTYEPCRVYSIYTTTSGYQSVYHFVANNYAEFSVNTNNTLVYSNLGDYPDLIERGDYLETALLIIVCVIVFSSLLSRFFSFNLRYKR